MIKIQTKKIGKFLKSLNQAEFAFLTHTINIVDGIQDLIKRYKVEKQEFCDAFNISLEQYDDFTSGNWNYDLMNIATLSATTMHYRIKNIKADDVIKVTQK